MWRSPAREQRKKHTPETHFACVYVSRCLAVEIKQKIRAINCILYIVELIVFCVWASVSVPLFYYWQIDFDWHSLHLMCVHFLLLLLLLSMFIVTFSTIGRPLFRINATLHYSFRGWLLYTNENGFRVFISISSCVLLRFLLYFSVAIYFHQRDGLHMFFLLLFLFLLMMTVALTVRL